MLEVNNLKKSFRGKEVLRDISFRAESGSVVGILGENGCGKSTLLSILAGVLAADGGTAALDGADVLGKRSAVRGKIGYAPQGTPLLEELTARDNLRLRYDRAEMEKELNGGVLAALGIDGFLKTTVSKLSGGMKKRLSIGCSVAGRPPVLLLDEPCAALDLSCKANILDFIDAHRKSGGIAVLTSHDQTEIATCDKWYVMKDGVLHEFVYDGDIGKLVAQF
ncbi:MAG: ABC transporter ATP-binding protein [Clostridia bacterium]|nr:ABC transporter ATP-binding protein [Clostridia bacterium]